MRIYGLIIFPFLIPVAPEAYSYASRCSGPAYGFYRVAMDWKPTPGERGRVRRDIAVLMEWSNFTFILPSEAVYGLGHANPELAALARSLPADKLHQFEECLLLLKQVHGTKMIEMKAPAAPPEEMIDSRAPERRQ